MKKCTFFSLIDSEYAFLCRFFSSTSLLQEKRKCRSLCIFVAAMSGRISIICDHSSLQLTTYWKSYLNETKISHSLVAWMQPYLNVFLFSALLIAPFQRIYSTLNDCSNIKKMLSMLWTFLWIFIFVVFLYISEVFL